MHQEHEAYPDHTPTVPADAIPPSILVVYAHPDDESFGLASALARYAREGSTVYGLFFTAGQHGDTGLEPPPSPEELGRLRVADLRDATAALGFAGVDVLDYEDGTLDQVAPRQLVEDVLQAIRRYHPEAVITFGPAVITFGPAGIPTTRTTSPSPAPPPDAMAPESAAS